MMSLSTEALWFLLWFLTFKFLVAEDHDVKVRLPMTYAIYGDQGDYNAQTWPSQMTPSGTLWQSNIAIENHKFVFFYGRMIDKWRMFAAFEYRRVRVFSGEDLYKPIISRSYQM